VRHLDDLLLRRTRLGLLLRDGGTAHLDRIRAICEPELGWSAAHWAHEEAAYRASWTLQHGLPHED
jgi:glycerol-3-phosphate dehydrogenase